jgi:peptide/nickel transport system substrate-binding protein
MKKLFALIGLTSLLLVGCTETTEIVTVDEKPQTETRGGVAYGGEITINSTENYSSLFPLEITDAYSGLIGNNVYEGLMRINKENLKVEECLAEKMTINDVADEFTFTLKQGVKFHDDACFEGGKGREMKASDVAFCLTNACSNFKNNKQADFLIKKIKGAQAFYNGKAEKVEGIQVNGDYEIKIVLEKSFAGFDKLLSHLGFSIYPKEAFDKYGEGMNEHMVGTGPFQQGSLKNGTEVILKKNPNYWEKDEFGNQLPYADGIKISYIKSKKDEIMAFKSGKLDILTGMPVDHIDDFVGSLEEAQQGKNKKHRYNSINGLNVDYIGFLGTHEIFGNENVRKAFAHAVDRKSIVEIDLEGDATVATNGVVPPMADYDESKVIGFIYSPELAKSYLKKSGMNAANFPLITLYYNSSTALQEIIAKSVQRDILRNLGIKIEIKANKMSDHNTMVSNSQAAVWKLGWVADYPDPENFLNLFYGGNIQEGSYLNAFKFKNEKFDALFDEASKESDVAKRMNLLQQCDQILMDQAIVLPLMHKNVELITAAKIKNCNVDPMGSIDLKNTYIKEKKQKAEQ